MTDIAKLLTERGSTHGDYTENARVSQNIMAVLQGASKWATLTAVQMESLHMFAHKMARIVGGDPNVADHWEDIAGYAKLVVDRLPKPKSPFAPPLAVPAEDSNRHAPRLRRQVNHSELMGLPREDQLRYRFEENEQSYVLQPGKVVAGVFLPEKIKEPELRILLTKGPGIINFYNLKESLLGSAPDEWILNVESDND